MLLLYQSVGLPLMAQQTKNPAMQEKQETWVQILGPGRSIGGGNGNTLSILAKTNPMDKGAWQQSKGLQRITRN